MIIISLHGISKGYPLGDVLRGIDWEIRSGEKIALLGLNGSGKSTLLGILSGRITADAGSRTVARGARIAEMSQIPERDMAIRLFDYLVAARGDVKALQHRVEDLARELAAAPDDESLHEQLGAAQSELEHAGGYELDNQVERVLTGLGFPRTQWHQVLGHFSGGERTRIELGRLLLTPADLFLLDEPTNHLDIPAVEWLEEFLSAGSVACILVSHDRVLLDRFAGRVAELTSGVLEQYDGNYRYYREERNRRLERRQKAYDLQQAEIHRIEDFIARNIAGQKTKQAQSKRRALAKVERLEAPKEERRTMRLGFETTRTSYREVLTIRDLSIEMGGRRLIDGLSLVVERGDKVGVIGPNGAGKSTLLRAIVGHGVRYDGEIRAGERVEIGYFDQHLEILSGHATVIEEIWDEHPTFEALELRSYLARFLFRGEDVFKPVSALSGGEQCRLALAKLMLTRANFLILDEPTNHLDITAREVLEEALAGFDGTAIVVSHDRRFLDRFTTKILHVAEGGASISLGNYSEWAARRATVSISESSRSETAPSKAAQEWQERKAQRAEAQRLRRRREQLEDRIARIEERVEALEVELADESVAREWQRLADMTEERKALYNELDALYEELETLPVPSQDA